MQTTSINKIDPFYALHVIATLVAIVLGLVALIETKELKENSHMHLTVIVEPQDAEKIGVEF